VKRSKPELPLTKVVDAEQAQRLPLLGHTELTLRDEANAMTAWAFRDGGLQDIGPEAAPGVVPRISNAEMKQLLVASSARLAHWLAVRERYVGESPAAYHQLIALAKMVSTDGWERQALAAGEPPPSQCRSCEAIVNGEAWRYCPACGTDLRH
jgi:hypothetical protein